MEGSAFYQVANKITSHELIVVLKIVSDNSDYNIKKAESFDTNNKKTSILSILEDLE